MDALLTALARLARGQFYVFQPPAIRHRLKKVVSCPEMDEVAEISLQSYPGRNSSIRNCSLWPAKRGCTRTCLRQAAVSQSR